MKKTVEQARAENLAAAIKHGPGLRASTNVWIEARDPKRGVVLLGGLGALGCGEMWAEEEPRHRDYPGYEDAKRMDTGSEPLFGLAPLPVSGLQ